MVHTGGRDQSFGVCGPGQLCVQRRVGTADGRRSTQRDRLRLLSRTIPRRHLYDRHPTTNPLLPVQRHLPLSLADHP